MTHQFSWQFKLKSNFTWAAKKMEVLNEQNKLGRSRDSANNRKNFSKTVRRRFHHGFEVLLYRSGGLICAERSTDLFFNWYVGKIEHQAKAIIESNCRNKFHVPFTSSHT